MKSTVEIITNLSDIDEMKRHKFRIMAQAFDAGLPDTLYMNQYDLCQPQVDPDFRVLFNPVEGATPSLWEDFLDIPEIYQFVKVKQDKIAEKGAKKALAKLMEKGFHADNKNAVAALKTLIEKTDFGGESNQRQVVLSFVSAKQYELGSGGLE